METKFVPGTAPDGAPILSVLAKETFKFENGAKAVVDEENPLPFYESDSFLGNENPAKDPVKHESDLIAFKPQTDVIIVGKAMAPNGKKARFFDVIAGVNQMTKKVRVFGNRKIFKTPTGVEFSEPELFEEMPLHYGLAYGGVDDQSHKGITYSFSPNPVGKGFIVKPTPEALHELDLPNLEDPDHLLTTKNIVVEKYENWLNMPRPMSFSYMGKNFHPRLNYAGMTFDQFLEQEQYIKEKINDGAEAKNFEQGSSLINPLFYNGASPGLRFPYLKGDEVITLMYMDPEHPKFQFQLPGIRPTLRIDVGSGEKLMQSVIHTIEVYKPTNQVTVVWRGSVYYSGLESMKEFTKFEYGLAEMAELPS